VANRPRPVLARPIRNGRRELDVVFEVEDVFELEVLGMSVAMRPLLRTSTRASSALAC
jgi:hypothetical protein